MEHYKNDTSWVVPVDDETLKKASVLKMQLELQQRQSIDLNASFDAKAYAKAVKKRGY